MKNALLACALFDFFVFFVLLINLVPAKAQIITVPATSPAVTIAQGVAQELNHEFLRRVGMHRSIFATIWRNPDATPDAIIAALGNQGARLFQLSSENLQHIDHIAELLGKDVSDYIPAADRVPPRQVILHPDGTVTLGPST